MRDTTLVTSNILFVDDDEGLCALVCGLLNNSGLSVVAAHSAKEADNHLANKEFDLVLVDYKLPDECGISVVERHSQNVACILITAMGDEELVVQAMQRGAKDYVVKDSLGKFIKQLPDIIKRVISQDRLYKDLISTQERLRKVFDEAPDLMVVTDTKFKVLDVSESAAQRYKCKSLLKNTELLKYVSAESLHNLAHNNHAHETVEVDFGYRSLPFKLTCHQLSHNEQMFVFHNLTDSFEVAKAERTIAKISQEKLDLQEQNRNLTGKLDPATSLIVGLSPEILKLKKIIASVADTNANVLILGETGTGKELVADDLHGQSARKSQAIIKLNCAAIPENLVESELFGHVRGSFSGAVKDHKGRFELADLGTLFLDEVGELSLPVQAKLLRVLQEGKFERVGGNRLIEVDVRIIAATNRDLLEMVQQGTFRADLFYRLNVIVVDVPPLRRRKGDVVLLMDHFMALYSKSYNRKAPTLNNAQLQSFSQYAWPGNIRELQNAVERLIVLGSIQIDNLADIQRNEDGQEHLQDAHDTLTLAEVERRHIRRILDKYMWRISGDKGAAKVLGLNPSTLRFRMQKLGLNKDTGNE